MGGKRGFQTLVAVSLLAVIGSYYFSMELAASARCLSVRVRVRDSAELGFVTPRRVTEYLRGESGGLEGRRLNGLNTHQLELALLGIPSVRAAEVYVDCENRLNVTLSQRRPLFRVQSRGGQACYVDHSGRPFPLDTGYTAHTLVFTGALGMPPTAGCQTDTAREEGSGLWHDLYALARHIDSHETWRALIGQVYVVSAQRVELVPRVGGFIINLGGLDSVPYKFDKLRSLYRASLPGVGLGAYSVVDLSYSDQVVCVHRE